jgi:hypothetical protein
MGAKIQVLRLGARLGYVSSIFMVLFCQNFQYFKIGTDKNLAKMDTRFHISLDSRACIIKLFSAVIHSEPQKARVFVTVSHFLPCLIFAGKTRAYSSGVPYNTHLSG